MCYHVCMKAITGYEGLYSVTEDGRIYSHRRNKYLATRKHPRGYLQASLWKDGKEQGFLVHRLVAQAYLPLADGQEFINHKDFDRTNNKVSNLEWCTQAENVQHSTRNDRHARAGGRNRELSEYQVIMIRTAYENEGIKQSVLAKEYSISPALVNLIVHYKRYVD